MNKGKIKIRDIIDVIEKWAPLKIAEEWDNPGFLLGDREKDIDSVTICLDVDNETLENAYKNKSQLIISHHPLIFRPLRKITNLTNTEKLIVRSIKENISVYSSHTNLDSVRDGVSFALAEKLGIMSPEFLRYRDIKLAKFVTFVPVDYAEKIIESASAAGAGIIGNYSNCSFMSDGTGTFIPMENTTPFSGKKGSVSKENEKKVEIITPLHIAEKVVLAVKSVHPYEEMAYDLIPLMNADRSFGYGAVGNLSESLSTENFLDHIIKTLETESLRISSCRKKRIKRVAVMGGSGGKFIADAIDKGADIYITAEIGYHEFLEYGEDILLVEVNHNSTEYPVLYKIKEKLELSFNKRLRINVHVSKTKLIKYYV